MEQDHAPILSTPAEHIFESDLPAILPTSHGQLSDEQLYIQYEIHRTVDEIRQGRWKRIALQFPDDMLVDAPRVFEALQKGLRLRGLNPPRKLVDAAVEDTEDVTERLQETDLNSESHNVEERLTILADTSYGACCVDEVAAEHVDADVVVHYGRSCLSPTARLPVIYVFTAKPLDLEMAVERFCATFPEKSKKICLMADIPYNHHLKNLQTSLSERGYSALFRTEIIHSPSSLLPNRSVPDEVEQNPGSLKEYSVFHFATPPPSLLLVLASRIQSMYIYQAEDPATSILEASTAQLLRRRYALLTRLSTVPIFGILINTLSVSNYMTALQHCQDLIARAGKKSYVFVVGKVNAAKVANFSEIGGWVVIGCWESSLIESKEFYRPIITPFELEVALTDDKERVWNGHWIADFSELLKQKRDETAEDSEKLAVEPHDENHTSNWDDELSEDEPPEFDLRTGRYVSHSRPMGRMRNGLADGLKESAQKSSTQNSSSALIQRAKGDVANIRGEVSPAAEFLRTKRTWKGLGSDFEVSYERNEDGTIRGSAMEEGRGGIAKGYEAEGSNEQRSSNS